MKLILDDSICLYDSAGKDVIDITIDLDPSKTYIFKDGKCRKVPKKAMRNFDVGSRIVALDIIESWPEVK
jgi:hypothetical protein